MSDKQTSKTFKEWYLTATKDSFGSVSIELAWNAAVEETRAKYDDKIKAMQAEIDNLKEIIDMNDAIIDGMRRILAVSRMVNNQRPDVRMTHALNDYDKCKLKN